jgi:tRNA modification GTPase
MSAPTQDTICAIATPVGEGGIGILRVSGEKAVEIAAHIVRLRTGRPLASLQSRRLYHADIVEAGATDEGKAGALDEALVVVMRAPRSYTGEDTVEVHCHGGPFVLQTVSEALVRLGARLAEPGEFTKRAFLNGRLDLTQAEAVLDTIRAKTAGALRMAQAQLRGTLSKELDRLREGLIGTLAHVEAGIDFTEEDLAFIAADELISGLERALAEIAKLVESGREGRILREGVTAAIIGRPNVGKSSLLNALLSADRAIVTPIPGTTRDVLEEVANIRGVAVRLLDTAGLRETEDPIEQEGVRRSKAAGDGADLLLIVLDGSVPLSPADREFLSRNREKKWLLVVNKADLPGGFDLAEIGVEEHDPRGTSVVRISAKTGQGLDDLRDRIKAVTLETDFEPGERAAITRLRHQVALARVSQALANALGSARAGLPGELVAMDLRAAIDGLGEITGTVTTEDILDRIFRDFCIGK